MIVKARTGKGGQALSRYLQADKNEHVEVLEYRNMYAESLNAAIFTMDNLARGSKCQKHALHVQMRAAAGERLSADHWREAADRYAEAFGIEENQAVIVLHHQQDGATHCHIVFNRVHPETLKTADMWQNYKTHKRLARDMEKDWGLRQVSSQKREQHRDYSNAGSNEYEQAKRTGHDVHDIREQIRGAWEHSDNAQSFKAALESEGFVLAKGDRRDYVVLDDNGHVYSIGKRTTGAKTADVQRRMNGLNPETVPHVDDVRLALEMSQEVEAKVRDGRKGRGEGEGTASATLAMKEAQHTDGKHGVFFFDPQYNRVAKWSAAAARRIDRLREQHTKEYEKQQSRFDKAANLERGEAVQSFNGLKRYDETAALLKRQAEELGLELQSQQKKREAFIEAQFIADQRREEYAQRGRDFEQSQIKHKLKLSDEVTEDTLDEEISRKLKGLVMKGINQANLEHKRALQRLRDPMQRPSNENQQNQSGQSKDKVEPESWMQQGSGFKLAGYDNLSDEHKQAAQKSYEAWRSAGDKHQQANRSKYGLQDYVAYVQNKERERNIELGIMKAREEDERKKANPAEIYIKANDRADDISYFHDENADQLRQAEEQAQNQAARARQETARAEHTQTTSAASRQAAKEAAEQAERVKYFRELIEANRRGSRGRTHKHD